MYWLVEFVLKSFTVFLVTNEYTNEIPVQELIIHNKVFIKISIDKDW